MERFWVYLENKVQGPVEIPSLRKLTGFNLLTQVCQEGQESWRMADDVIEIKAYFSAPPRGSSLIQPDLPVENTQSEMSLPMSSLATDTLPPASNQPLVETLDDLPVAVGNTLAQPAPAAGGLRQSCATCGYKNPRDVTVCMKCGGPLKSGAVIEDKPKISLSALMDSPVAVKTTSPKPAEGLPVQTAPVAASMESPMVEIPVKRIAIILLSVALTGGVFFAVQHMWKAKHRSRAPLHPVVVNTSPAPDESSAETSKSRSKRGTRRIARAQAAVLPGVSAAPKNTDAGAQSSDEGNPKKENVPAHSATRTPASSVPASYTVVDGAYPRQHRMPAPVDSKYAAKRRGDRGLWSSKEEQAIQQVQNQRIYGGLRTIRRNAEILMQILRDREYMSAFESGKRISLFNDADWAAVQTDGPVFEVQLTFSGGKEADGSSRTPLRFAFRTDLERQTVEPGSSGMIKSNTMHAFFDESRIPPDERRSVAQDTEELVQAAQPGGSPLALETITQHYAATYSFPALTRVAQAYGLNLVTKKLARQTASVSDVLPEASGSKKPAGQTTFSTPASKPVALAPSASGAIQYTMERGSGKERLITAQVPSRAAPAKLWETLTSYDRLTQFVPDVLVSQREGQDGAAVIVHTVSLTRLMFFVFKVNLHLRILEHPQQHRLEFERIAGDFEKFDGYVEIAPDAAGTKSSMDLHLTLIPNSYMPAWAIKSMTQHFLVPVLDAIRSKAESY